MLAFSTRCCEIVLCFALIGCAAGTQRFDEIMVAKVQKKAEFDFQCAQEELVVTKIDEGSYGVVGCSKRATYVGKDSQVCWPGNSEAGLIQLCQVVPDTFVEAKPED